MVEVVDSGGGGSGSYIDGGGGGNNGYNYKDKEVKCGSKQ